MNNLLDLAKTAAYVLVAMFAVLGVFTLGAAIWHWVMT